MYFNLLKTVVTVCTIYYNIQNICILPTECVHMFKMILTINSNYFLKQGYVCGLCNWDYAISFQTLVTWNLYF